MNLHKMNIKEEYLTLIKEGIKKHEYRLYNDKRKLINIDDYLLLVSCTNSNDFIKVRVTDIKVYKTWKDALFLYWKEDFNNMYSSLIDLINECDKFYNKEEVEKYGIVVYTIELGAE